MLFRTQACSILFSWFDRRVTYWKLKFSRCKQTYWKLVITQQCFQSYIKDVFLCETSCGALPADCFITWCFINSKFRESIWWSFPLQLISLLLNFSFTTFVSEIKKRLASASKAFIKLNFAWDNSFIYISWNIRHPVYFQKVRFLLSVFK